jgi:hypothetical protein
MGFPQNEVAADNERRRVEEASKSPVGGVLENAVSLARPALAAASAVIATGAAAGTGLAVAGSVVAGLGIVDWFRKLGHAKVNENLESLGQATEDALNRVELILLEHGTSIDEIRSRLNSQEFKDGMVSASLQALRTTQEERLKRLARILANGVRENDLVPESLDDMMRAAVDLKESDVLVLKVIYEDQSPLFGFEHLATDYAVPKVHDSWDRLIASGTLSLVRDRSSLGRLQSHGLIQQDFESRYGSNAVAYILLREGKKFYERLREIAP